MASALRGGAAARDERGGGDDDGDQQPGHGRNKDVKKCGLRGAGMNGVIDIDGQGAERDDEHDDVERFLRGERPELGNCVGDDEADERRKHPDGHEDEERAGSVLSCAEK